MYCTGRAMNCRRSKIDSEAGEEPRPSGRGWKETKQRLPDREGGDGKRASSASLTVGVLPRILMQQQEWQKIKEVFTAALEQPVAMRAQFLTETCGDDEALRGEVESLLAAQEEPKNLLEQHAIDLASQLQTDGDKYRGKLF